MSFDLSAGETALLLDALLGTVRSSCIAIVLLVIGAPVSHLLATRFGPGRVTIALGMACGLFVLSAISWYGFRFGISVKYVYQLVIALAALWSIVFSSTMLRARGVSAVWRRYLPTALRATAAFVAPVFVYSVLSFAKIKPDTLPLLSNGNLDLLAYLKLGDVLLALPDAETLVSTMDIRNFITEDVFGVFNLISLGSFVLRAGVEECAIPVLGFGIGLISLGIATICQRIFALPWWLSIFLAVLCTTSPLFSYVFLSYFLGQVLFIGLLLIAFLSLTESANGGERSSRFALAVSTIISANVMFIYHPWFEQFVVLSSMAFGGALLMREDLTKRDDVVLLAASASFAAFVVVNLFDLAVGTSRYFLSVEKLTFAAVTGVAGWPLPFVNLALLLGIPAWWQTPEVHLSVVGQALPAIVIIVLVLYLAWRYDTSGGNRGRRFALCCFAASVALYLVAWGIYGASYRQWKFATTLSAPLGFTVAASVLYMMLQDRYRLRHGATVVLACAFLGVILQENISQYFDRWSATVFPFPKGLREASRGDDDPTAQAVYIDVPEIMESMAAAIFVNDKPILFAGPTYYGHAAEILNLPYERVAVFRQSCSSRVLATPAYDIDNVPLATVRTPPTFPLRRTVALSSPGMHCLELQGFSGAEAWGRWTDGKSASLRARCACDLSKTRVKMVLNAGTLLYSGKVERQRVIFRVNGTAPQERILDSMEHRNIVIDLPPAPDDQRLIDVEIELPDAVSPSITGVADTRVLGLSVVSVTLTES